MRRWHYATALAAAGLTAALFGGTAHATPGNSGAYSTTFVDGAGKLTDDFSDNAREIGSSICNGCSNSWGTDTVAMWQAILVAEGFLSPSGIDGRFGPGTDAATKSWQGRYGLSKDGKVGPNTWNKADNRIKWASSGVVAYYEGRRLGQVLFERGDSYNKPRDGGAYRMTSVFTTSGDRTGMGGTRIHHFKLTVV